jgi:hypothetical protein
MTAMYEIDFTTCAALDVIQRSITCHPTMLVETLRANAATHEQAGSTMYDRIARETAYRMGGDCRTVANTIENLGTIPPDLTFGERTQAFSAAAKLQLIPFPTALVSVAR